MLILELFKRFKEFLLMKAKLFAAAFIAVVAGGNTQAATLSGSGLSVEIREDNGAIDSFVFGSSDFFNQGAFVSDFGASVDGSFFLNTTTGDGSGFSVSEADGNVSASGAFGDLNVQRNYTLDASAPVLRITTTLINTRATDLLVNFFETFDPDQGVDVGGSFSTLNDVTTTAGGHTVATSTATGATPLAAVLGGTDFDALEAGNVFQIDSLTDLDDVLYTPVDSNGGSGDDGQHIVYSFNLTAGESVTFDTFLAAGSTLAEGLQNYDTAVISPVPLPASTSFLLTALGGLALLRRRSKAAA